MEVGIMQHLGAVILAAGESRRMGRPKQLLPWGDSTLIDAVVGAALAAPVAELVVVLGHTADRVEQAVNSRDPRLSFVRNEQYRSGMLSSVRAGVAALSDRCEAFFLYLGDQPWASPAVAAQLARAYTPGAILVPTADGRRGHPVLFSLTYRVEITELDDAVGLRQLLWRHPAAVRTVAVAEPAIHVDLDTPEDYDRYRGREE
jgi:molybdenum cofactor cytidylyltransferase